jgi:toxin-antitoxin system PIN domain toxin
VQGYYLDTNVWVAASLNQHPEHERSFSFLSERTSKDSAWISNITAISWMRLITTQSVAQKFHSHILSNQEAITILKKWLNQPEIQYMDTEPEGTFSLWQQLSASPFPSPKTWMDAYIAAIAIQADLPLVTFDKGFQAYTSSGLQLVEI